jgi:PKD repeat protein
LELNSNIPSGYNAFFAGWNRANTAATSGVGIHHPAGSAKKISTFTSSLSSVSYNGGAPNAHWLVTWSSTANGHGVTEGGSSGSPIFNQNGQIVGQLSGGSSFCNAVNDPDLYGKMSSNWAANGTNNNARLQPWLDPTGSGVNSLAGTYNPCTPVAPIANFSADQTNVNTGATVSFTDLSSGSPSSWSWSITPGTGWTFASGSATSQNPQITFNTAGTYTVELTATNGQGSDTETKTNYITVTDPAPTTCINVQTSSYSMGFEQSEDLSEWAVYNMNGDQTGGGNAITWGIGEESTFASNNIPMTAHTGTRMAFYFYSASSAADDWLVTPCIDLEPGYDYTLTFWHRVALAAFPEKMKVEIGGTQNPTGMSTTLIDLGSVDNETYVQESVTFTVTSAGEYYIGFHCYSDADEYVLGLDDINLSAVQNGGGNPVSVDILDNWENQISLFPNPAKNAFNVELSNENINVERVELYSVSGQLIETQLGNQQHAFTFNVEGKAEGLYMVKIVTDKGTSIKKVTKY